MAVAHQPAPAPLVHKPSMSYEERFDLGLDRLRQHPPSTLAQHAQQRIVRDARSWPRQRNNPILLHGVSFQVTSTITEDTPPPASSPKFEHSSAANPKHIRAEFDHGDHLHPNDAGYEAMAKSIDLSVIGIR